MYSVLFLVHHYSCVLFSRLSIIENTQPSPHWSEKLRFDCTLESAECQKRTQNGSYSEKMYVALHSCIVKHKEMICT